MKSRLLRRLVLIPLALCLVAGKRRAEVPPSPPMTAESAVAAMADSFALDVDIAIIEVGAPPLAPLRYLPRGGTEGTTRTTQATAVAMTVVGPDGKQIPVPVPGVQAPTVVDMRWRVDGPDDAGACRVHQSFDSDNPLVGAAMEGSIDYVVDAQGHASGFVVESNDPTTRQLLERMLDGLSAALTIFPSESIGVGGRWLTTMDMSMIGMSIHAETTQTLVERSGDHVVFDSATVFTQGKGDLAFPGMPGGMTMVFDRFEGTGTGRFDVNLSSLVTSGRMTSDLSIGMTMSAAPMPGPMTLDGTIHMDMLTESVQ